MSNPKPLRQTLKHARRELTDAARASAQARVIERIARYRPFLKARRIAFYVGSNGEIDPMPLAQIAVALGKHCYLPVLHPFQQGRLWFARWTPDTAMMPNRFGIPEPDPRTTVVLPARDLDLVIVPLLGFDTQCHRLGMGGGFYDRTFAFRRRRSHLQRPHLAGIAFDLQRVAQIEQQPWDVKLDAVFTEQRVYA